MQERLENAWHGYVSVVQKALGIDLSRQQSKLVDANQQSDFTNWASLQEFSESVGEQCGQPEPTNFALWSFGWAELQYAT